MRTSWFGCALIMFVMGLILTITFVGAIIGVPLIIISLIILIIGIFLPNNKKIVHIHKHKK